LATDLATQFELLQQATTLAQKYNLPPEMVAAVIRQESGFDPNATSKAGAQGLMQLMPGTAREMGVQNSYDPSQNLEGGIKYLSQMMGQFHNDPQLALAAYNAGPGRVQRAGGVPNIPETQNYVQRITANMQPAQAMQQAPQAPPSGGGTLAEAMAQVRQQGQPQRDLAAEFETLQNQTPTQSGQVPAQNGQGDHWTKWLPAAGGIGGEWLGTAVGAVPGKIIGSGVGAGAGEAAREFLNKVLYGESTENPLKNIAEEAAISAGTSGTLHLMGMAGKAMARGAYTKVLKPSDAVLKATNAFRGVEDSAGNVIRGSKVAAEKELAETGLREGLGINERGFIKGRNIMDTLAQEQKDRLAASGLNATKTEAATNLGQSVQVGGPQMRGPLWRGARNAAENVSEEFWNHPEFLQPVAQGTQGARFLDPAVVGRHPLAGQWVKDLDIPLDRLSEMKSAAYKDLVGKFGADAGNNDEALKSLALGMKDIINTKTAGTPFEVASLNKRMSELLPTLQAINNAGQRIGKKDFISWGDLGALGAGGVFGANAASNGGNWKVPPAVALAYTLLRRPQAAVPIAQAAWRVSDKGTPFASALIKLLLNGQNHSAGQQPQ
jgi:hypothetical protein